MYIDPIQPTETRADLETCNVLYIHIKIAKFISVGKDET